MAFERSPILSWLRRLVSRSVKPYEFGMAQSGQSSLGVTRALTLGLLLLALLARCTPSLLRNPFADLEEQRYRLLSLNQLPGVDRNVLEAQGTVLRVEEPFLYDIETGLAEFEVEVLSTEGFKTERWTDLLSLSGWVNALVLRPAVGDETRIAFEGDAQSLDNFVREVRLVNEGANVPASTIRGVWEGLKALLEGLWNLLRHPIESITDIGAAAVALAEYVKDTPTDQIARDIDELVSAYLMERACEVADRKSIQFLDMKTKRGVLVIYAEVGGELSGRLAFEVATIVVPFSAVGWVDKAADAGKVAKTAQTLQRAGMGSAGAERTARSIRLFPRLRQQTEALAKRFAVVAKPWLIKPSTNYRRTFFTKYPHLKNDVWVHHAVPRKVLERYPGVMTEADIHALKNLRGIPKAKNADLHLSKIHKEWNKFYRENPPGTVDAKKLLDKAQEIDRKYGHLFNPPVTLK
jgi:hypothetical protein